MRRCGGSCTGTSPAPLVRRFGGTGRRPACRPIAGWRPMRRPGSHSSGPEGPARFDHRRRGMCRRAFAERIAFGRCIVFLKFRRRRGTGRCSGPLLQSLPAPLARTALHGHRLESEGPPVARQRTLTAPAGHAPLRPPQLTRSFPLMALLVTGSIGIDTGGNAPGKTRPGHRRVRDLLRLCRLLLHAGAARRSGGRRLSQSNSSASSKAATSTPAGWRCAREARRSAGMART